MGRPRLRAIRWPTFVRDTFSYTGGSFVAQFSQVVYSILLRKILAPTVMGLWDFVAVVQNFALSFDLGITAAAAINLPVLRGAGQLDKAARARSTAFWASLGQGTIMALAIVAYGAFADLSGGLRTAAFVAAALMLLYSAQDALTVFLQANESYIGLSRVMIVAALGGLVLLPGGAAIGGVKGLFAGALGAYGLRVALLYWRSAREAIAPQRHFSARSFKGLVSLGFPLRVVEFPHAVLGILDVILVTKFLGVAGLAIYSTARLVFIQAANLPGYAGNVFVMRAFRLSGASVAREQLAADAREFLLVEYTIILPILLVTFVHGFSLLVGQVITQYTASLDVLTVLMFALFFVPQTTIVRNFWMLDRRLMALGISNVVGLIAHGLGLGITIAINGTSLESIAIGTVAGYGGYYLYLMATIGRELWGVRAAVLVTAHSAIGAAATASILGLVRPRVATGEPLVALGRIGWSLALCYALLMPMMLYGVRSTSVLRHFRHRHQAKSSSEVEG